MKNKGRLVLGLGVCAVAFGAWEYVRASARTAYRTEAAQMGRIQSVVSVTGTCSAVLTVPVGSQVSGTIKALYADFNTPVRKGQLVAEIDPLPFQEKVNQAQAALESAQAAVVAAKATVQKAEVDIRTAQATKDSQSALVAQAMAGERGAKITADRQQLLAKSSIVSDDQFETARATYDVAVADREAIDAQEHAAETTIDEMQEARNAAVTQEASAEAQIRVAEGALEQVKLDLEHTRITSPIDGVVISREVDVGQTVAANFAAPELFQIAQDLAKMQVDADIDEADVSRVKVGQVAQFSVDALPNRTFEARVRQVRQSPINVQNVITYDAVMDVPNPGLELLPGMTANIRIPVEVRDNALRVPNPALRYKPGEIRGGPIIPPAKGPQTQQVVYVPNAAGKPEERKIQIGITDGKYTEVVSGDLHPGEAVILQEMKK